MAVSVGVYRLAAWLDVPPPLLGVVVLVLPVICSLIVCCRFAMMPRNLVWAREQSLSSRVFAVYVSCKMAVLLISAVLWSFRFLVAAMEGRT